MSKYGLSDAEYAEMVKKAEMLRQVDPDTWIRNQLGVKEEAAPAPKPKKKAAKKKASKK